MGVINVMSFGSRFMTLHKFFERQFFSHQKKLAIFVDLIFCYSRTLENRICRNFHTACRIAKRFHNFENFEISACAAPLNFICWRQGKVRKTLRTMGPNASKSIAKYRSLIGSLESIIYRANSQ